ncbi:MAG: ATP-binding protein [Polyangia bacterium]
MSRGVLVALVALLTVAFLVIWGAMHAIGTSRQTLVEQFEQGEILRAVEVARGLSQDLDSVGDQLRFLAPLLASTDSVRDGTRVLRALLGVENEVRHALVLDENGALVLSIDAVSEPPLPAALAEDVLVPNAPRIATSRPLRHDPTGRLRAFSLSFGDRASPRHGSVVLVVDTTKMARLGGLHSGAPSARALLLDPSLVPAPISDPMLAEAARQLRTGSMKKLLAEVSGASGAVELSSADAAQLGFPRFPVVAAHVLATPRDADPWVVVTFRSSATLREHEQAVLWRVGLAALGIALCFVSFAAYVLWASRRAVALRERLHHADALAHLHEKTEKILDSLPAIVVTLSEQGHITALNRRAREALAADALGADLSRALPEAPLALVSELDSQVQLARREGAVQSLFGARLALFGEEGVFNVHAVPLEARTESASTLLVLEDVSKVQSLESQLVRAEKLATVGVLAAGIAHEIGTPLSVVRGRAEYISGKLGDDHPQRAGLEVIGREIERVVSSVKQLLDFSRVRPAEVSPVALSTVAETVRELLGYEAQRRGLALTIELPPELPPLLADADQLRQVLINLVMNAFDACSSGGHVALSARARGLRRLEITVIDDGAGIADAHRAQAFDPFFTTKKRGQGTGLGLAISAEIARRHGAEIELEPGTPSGTIARVGWPTVVPRHS